MPIYEMEPDPRDEEDRRRWEPLLPEALNWLLYGPMDSDGMRALRSMARGSTVLDWRHIRSALWHKRDWMVRVGVDALPPKVREYEEFEASWASLEARRQRWRTEELDPWLDREPEHLKSWLQRDLLDAAQDGALVNPLERQLANRYGVQRTSVHRAVTELERWGCVDRYDQRLVRTSRGEAALTYLRALLAGRPAWTRSDT